MIDDVESFVKVAAILKDRGAYKVFVMATHGILSCDASVIEDSCIDEVSACSFLSTTFVKVAEVATGLGGGGVYHTKEGW